MSVIQAKDRFARENCKTTVSLTMNNVDWNLIYKTLYCLIFKKPLTITYTITKEKGDE